ncbi:hypothetical protein DRN74_02140 [Candidatus Micrarchaeota archaeon]|nr:MAG: hypothetical protein DRN74_02140 [Candidatus Micrarchaeota archaeon]
MQSESKVLLKQNVWGQSSELLGFTTNVISNIIFPIILGSFAFGLLSIVLGFAYLVAGLISVGITNVAMLFVSKFTVRSQKKSAAFISYLFRIILVLSFLVAIMFIVFSDQLALIYMQPSISTLFKLAALIILARASFSLLATIFIAIGDAKYHFYSTLVNSALLIVLPLFLFISFGMEGFITGIGLAYLSALIFAVIVLKNKKLLSSEQPPMPKGPVLKHAAVMTALSLKNYFSRLVLLLMLGLFATSASAVAYFKVSMAWVSIVATLIPVSGSVIFASFVRMKEDSSKKLKYYLSRVLQYSLILLLPSMLILTLLGGRLIKLIYVILGGFFSVSRPDYLGAVMPMSIMSFFIYFSFIDSILYPVIASYKKLYELAKLNLFALLLSFIFSLYLIQNFGLLGAAVSYVLCAFLYFVTAIYVTYKFALKDIVKILGRYTKKPLLASIFMVLIVELFRATLFGFLGTLLLLFMSVFSYLLCLYFLRGIKYSDIKGLLNGLLGR